MPGISRFIDKLLEEKQVVFDHAIVCMRKLHDAAESRRAVRARRLERGLPPRGPGALFGTARPDRQERVAGILFHKLIFELSVHDVPITYVHFPHFARDPRYLFQKLVHIFPMITEQAIHRACEMEVKHDMIHDFLC
jgi:hypothetical protein